MATYQRCCTRWFFSREQLENTPSRRCGLESDRELSYRQQAANLIQDMGQRLNVSQLTINTAIVYMHRFYMHHSFTKFHRNIISPATLFLAAKVEEQPRKLEHVIKVAHACLNPQEPPLDTKSNAYLQQAQELVMLETVVLQTLGFQITIDHPHTDVVKCSQLVRASKDLAQTSYYMATNSLLLTTFCLQYKPTVIACVCIHLACKWSKWEIPVSTDGKRWWEYVDSTVTLQLLDELTHEFLQILEKTPSRLKRIRNWRATQAAKKPRSDMFASDGPIPGPSTQEPDMLDCFPRGPISSVSMATNPGSTLILDSGVMSYSYAAPNNCAPEPQPAPPAGQSGKPQPRMSLDKYREKQVAEELKMRSRASSDNHSSSDEGGAKSKDRQRHHRHSEDGAPEGPATLFRSPAGEGVTGSSSRKRTHPDVANNHHSSKMSRSKNAAGGLRLPQQHPNDTGQETGTSGDSRA